MINVWLRQSVRGQNHPMMQKAQGVIARLYLKKESKLMISSRGDGEHSPGSFHYMELCCAEDYLDRDKVVSLTEITNALDQKFGVGRFDVIEYAWGYHVEYDPK